MATIFYGTKIAYLKLNIRDLNLLKVLVFALIDACLSIPAAI